MSVSGSIGSPGCEAYPPEDWEKHTVLALGCVVVLIVLFDLIALRRRVWFLFNFRSRWTSLLLIPGLYALANVLSIYMRTSTAQLVMVDIQGVLRAWYLYEAITINFSYFSLNDGGTGSTDEAVERVGWMLEEHHLPRQKVVPPPFILYWGTLWVQPGRKFLAACVLRMQIAIVSNVLVLVVRPIVWDFGVHSRSQTLGTWDTGNIYLIIFNLFIVFLSLSAKLPLEKLVAPFVLPHSTGSVKLRKIQFILLFAMLGGVHGIIALVTTNLPAPCLWWVYHQNIFVAFWLLIIACIGHRVWLPPFHWSISEVEHYHPMRAMIDAANSHTGSYNKAIETLKATPQITVSQEDIARVLRGEKSIGDAQAEAKLEIIRGIQQHCEAQEAGLARGHSGSSPDLKFGGGGAYAGWQMQPAENGMQLYPYDQVPVYGFTGMPPRPLV